MTPPYVRPGKSADLGVRTSTKAMKYDLYDFPFSDITPLAFIAFNRRSRAVTRAGSLGHPGMERKSARAYRLVS